MDAYTNFAYGVIVTAPSPATSGTSLTVSSGHGARFPTVPFNATIWPINTIPDPTNAEIVRVTAIAGDVFTITRAQESTTARTVIVGDQIAATITKKLLDELSAAYASSVFGYGFSTSTTAPPANQTIRFNAGHPYTGVTRIYADFDDSASQDLYWGWMRIKVGSTILIQDKDNHLQYAEFKVTGTPIDQTSYVELPVSWLSNGSALAVQACLIRVIGPPVNPPTGALGLIIDGSGSAISTGVKGFLSVPFACTITGWTLLSTDSAATSGSIVIDIWKDTYANYAPTVADTITASAKPTLSSANKNTSTSLTGWTTAITAGDVLGFNVDSATTVTRIALILTVAVS